MARALRILRAGGRYHVTARGNESRDIFRDEPDRVHFLELLSQLGEQFGVRRTLVRRIGRRIGVASYWPSYWGRVVLAVVLGSDLNLLHLKD